MTSWRRWAWPAYVERLARSDRPILLGPWRSEVGFEALYWVPFLRKALQSAGIGPERLGVLTRGGAGVLYGLPSVDLYALRSVEQVRLENAYDYQRTKLQKQTAVTPWDRTVAREAADRLWGRGTGFHLMHPAWMYGLLGPWWDGQAGPAHLDRYCDYAPLVKPPRPPVDLPQTYVAMKWYDRVTWPVRDPLVQAWMREVVTAVAAHTPVVMLEGTAAADDHQDVLIQHPNVIHVPPVAPEQNLEQQLRILAHAQAFVGTYGGVAQTALRYRVPSVSFWRQFGGTAKAHLWLSDQLSTTTNTPFMCGSIEDGQAWRKVLTLPQVVPAPKAQPVEAA